MSLPATYSFPESSGAQLADPPWTASIIGYFLEGDGSGHCTTHLSGLDCIGIWNADSFPNDQYSQLVIASSPGPAADGYAELFVRTALTTGSGDPDGYMFYGDGVSSAYIAVNYGGAQDNLAFSSSVAFGPGDVLRLEATGALLTVYKNDVSVLSATDTRFTSGAAGIGGYTAGTPILMGTFEAGASSSGSPGVHTVTGRGSITVSSPSWLSTAITGRPAILTFGAAEPPNWYHVGMLSWGTDNGTIVSYPVTRDLDLVPLPPSMTTVWYEFEVGVTAIITELSAP